MSQINDALKRAKQSQTPHPPAGIPPLAPVEPAPSGRRWMILPAALVAIAAACFFAGPMACDHKTTAAPPATNEPAVITQAPPPAPAPKPAPAPPATSTLKVQGIVYAAANPMAIVNGKSVGLGDRIGTYRVKKISQNSVTFQKADGTLIEVKLGK